jgi:hypothetical protein
MRDGAGTLDADRSSISSAGGVSPSVRKAPTVSFLTLMRPKWLTARARAAAGERGRGARWAVLGVVGAVFWAIAFGLLYRVLR